jgi:hypothetical protein
LIDNISKTAILSRNFEVFGPTPFKPLWPRRMQFGLNVSYLDARLRSTGSNQLSDGQS